MTHNFTAADLAVPSLGPCQIDSPLLPMLNQRQRTFHNVDEEDRVLFDDTLSGVIGRSLPADRLPAFEPAGPRRKIYFDPAKIRAGIVTCGGLCPGFNDVIRSLVLELYKGYGVRKICGFRNGYEGFIGRYRRPVLDLTPDSVAGINEQGGTILGTSRGAQNPEEIVDCLESMGIDILFVVGGDGTLRAAQKIAGCIAARGRKIAIVGVPKTIDNDIMFIDQSFGFQTAVAEATRAIRSAHVEAESSSNGIGLVKLMGRHSGFIACYASLAVSVTNFVLIPEVPFRMEGDAGFLNLVHRRLEKRGHAVIVVAEGAGQELLAAAAESQATDASGNVRLGDIGVYLRRRLIDYFAGIGLECNLKYIDPSYEIRSVPANPFDSVYCIRLAHNAVHAAMSGRTEMVVGRWNGRFVHVPIPMAVRERNLVDTSGDLWTSVLEATGQPRYIG